MLISKFCRLALACFTTFLFTAILSTASLVYADEETGLCPENFTEGVVTTGYVDCFRTTGATSDREEAERRRLVREAECIAEPRSELIFSAVLSNSSGDFFPSLICRINRVVPAGTILCPDDSLEVYRAFDTLACEYFGSAANTMATAQQALAQDEAACLAQSGGSVLVSAVRIAESQDDDELFYFTDLSCGFTIPPTDTFECPVGFEELSRDEDLLSCQRLDSGLPSETEANRVNQQVREICSATTGQLGSVVFSTVVVDTSFDQPAFTSGVECEINLPRYGDYVDGDILRACDATCTLDIQEVRPCLNGGTAGGPGCSGVATRTVTRRCNTGKDRDGLCPLKGVPESNVLPLLLLDDDEEN
ncbi:hypothetical protein GCM10008090_00150 [Arenicella chitinivorans]|uniref:Uncharacterized protein n=1 Tax=Arenicella chitinivorans TaxID=1329800 RepID=A0A918RG23_9GAMM|nr:hypothetical protein [Arenicella chitinivorans]GGZ95946.1 hypothetical protein GCM10008090_00150 [Arenicella chitinivorans]